MEPLDEKNCSGFRVSRYHAMSTYHSDSEVWISEDIDTDPPLHLNCELCSIPLSMHLHVGSNSLLKVRPTISVLACNHCFHSACLEEVTTVQQRDNPSCPVFGGSPQLCAQSQEERILNIQKKKALKVAAQVPTSNQKVSRRPAATAQKQEKLAATEESSTAERVKKSVRSTSAAKEQMVKANEKQRKGSNGSGTKKSRTRHKFWCNR